MQKPWIIEKYTDNPCSTLVWQSVVSAFINFDPCNKSNNFDKKGSVLPANFINQLYRISLLYTVSAFRILQIGLNTGLGLAVGSVKKSIT